jgi:predicted Zn-dependent protease
MRTALLVACCSLLALPLFAQTRLASDFEIAQMEQQLARSRDFESQLSGRLNLGDVRAARNEKSLARAEYVKALELAERERLAARRDSSTSRYANATSYAALAQAKLRRAAESFALLEEAARYTADDPETWNLYASAMRTLGHPKKAVAAARNAVAIASTKADKLDLAVYQYALATAIVEAGDPREAEQLLVTLIASLRSPEFASLQREVARGESFEVYSSAQGDVAAYVSLLNRAQLRLAALHERRGNSDEARAQYERVLESRSDDVTALTALQRWEEAFDANPFSMPLIRAYQRALRERPEKVTGTSTGAQMRRALVQLSRNELRAARTTLDALLQKFPANETLRMLRREAEGATTVALPASATPTAVELRSLLANFERLTPEQRALLDQATFTNNVRFDLPAAEAAAAPQLFASGSLLDVPFRFASPTQFNGTYDTTRPLRLTYRILGVTTSGEADALLLEPVQLEEAR